MRQDVIDLAQAAIWDSPLGDPVSVFAPRCRRGDGRADLDG